MGIEKCLRTNLRVIIVGPRGVGKSTLAAEITGMLSAKTIGVRCFDGNVWSANEFAGNQGAIEIRVHDESNCERGRMKQRTEVENYGSPQAWGFGALVRADVH